jgi:SOUL heme-binding protein
MTNRFALRALPAVLLLLAGEAAMAIEEPRYTVTQSYGDIELRDYSPYLVAETVVEGDFDAAGNEGFRRLFRYIAGDNRASAEISMTAPVAQQPVREKIAMTVPVAQVPEATGHRVSFVVPSKYSIATAPKPLDPRVQVREIAAQRVAVVRFSGFWTDRRYREEKARLLAFLAERGLAAGGEPQVARYNAPYVPPFLRRNEILIPLAATAAVGTMSSG